MGQPGNREIAQLKRALVNDVVEAKDLSSKMVEETKAGISKFMKGVSKRVCNVEEDVEEPNEDYESISRTSLRERRASRVEIIESSVGESLHKLKEKTLQDVAVIQLYDAYQVKEMAKIHKVRITDARESIMDLGSTYVAPVCFVKDTVVEDFTQIDEDYEEQVNSVKSAVGNYLSNFVNGKHLKGNPEDDKAVMDVLSKVTTKAKSDFQKQRSESEKLVGKLVGKSLVELKDQFAVFKTNPIGAKSTEELQVEEFSKVALHELKDKILSDLIATKSVTDKIAAGTKLKIEEMVASRADETENVGMEWKNRTLDDVRLSQKRISIDASAVKHKVERIFDNTVTKSQSENLRAHFQNKTQSAVVIENVQKQVDDIKTDINETVAIKSQVFQDAGSSARDNIRKVEQRIQNQVDDAKRCLSECVQPLPRVD